MVEQWKSIRYAVRNGMRQMKFTKTWLRIGLKKELGKWNQSSNHSKNNPMFIDIYLFMQTTMFLGKIRNRLGKELETTLRQEELDIESLEFGIWRGLEGILMKVEEITSLI